MTLHDLPPDQELLTELEAHHTAGLLTEGPLFDLMRDLRAQQERRRDLSRRLAELRERATLARAEAAIETVTLPAEGPPDHVLVVSPGLGGVTVDHDGKRYTFEAALAFIPPDLWVHIAPEVTRRADLRFRGNFDGIGTPLVFPPGHHPLELSQHFPERHLCWSRASYGEILVRNLPLTPLVARWLLSASDLTTSLDSGTSLSGVVRSPHIIFARTLRARFQREAPEILRSVLAPVAAE